MIIYNVHIQDFPLYYWIVFFLIDWQEVLFVLIKHILDINLLQVFVLKYLFSVSIFYLNYFYSFWMKLEKFSFMFFLFFSFKKFFPTWRSYIISFLSFSSKALMIFKCNVWKWVFLNLGYPSVHNNLLKSTLFLQWPAIHFLSYIKDPHMSRSVFGLSILFHLTRPLCHNYYAFIIILSMW